MNFGQTCHAGTRIYIHEEIYDKFLEKFTERMRKINVGHPFDQSTRQGPVNSKMQHSKILEYIESGKTEGAELHLGGEAIDKSGGYYIQPTIFTNVSPNMKVRSQCSLQASSKFAPCPADPRSLRT